VKLETLMAIGEVVQAEELHTPLSAQVELRVTIRRLAFTQSKWPEQIQMLFDVREVVGDAVRRPPGPIAAGRPR